jgi:hypothetical protein
MSRYAASWPATGSTTLVHSHDGAASRLERLRLKSARHFSFVFASICRACASPTTVCGLPCVTVRSAPAITFSGPAQRLLTLWPARSRSRHATLSIESSDSFVAFHCRFDCYRVERTSSRAGVAPAEVQHLSRRTITSIDVHTWFIFNYDAFNGLVFTSHWNTSPNATLKT